MAPLPFAQTINCALSLATLFIKKMKDKVRREDEADSEEESEEDSQDVRREDEAESEEESQNEDDDDEEVDNAVKMLDPSDELSGKKLKYEREPKRCQLCGKSVVRLDIHLRKAHKLLDKKLRNIELQKQKMKRLEDSGKQYRKCPDASCSSVLTCKRVDMHLLNTKKHSMKRDDAVFKTMCIEAANQQAPTSQARPVPSYEARGTSGVDVFQRAREYYEGISGCSKNAQLYTKEMETMVQMAGRMVGRKPTVKLLYSGDTEILTRIKHELTKEGKKPNTVKKYLTAAVKFSQFLQASPFVTRDLRISQTNVTAVKMHAKNLRQGLSSSLLQSLMITKMGHEAQRPSPQDIDIYLTKARKEMSNLEEKILNGSGLTTSETLFFRNHLITTIIWCNASRAGELKNVTLADYQRRTIRGQHLAIPISEHKTLTSHGEAYIIIEGLERRWLEKYITDIRPQSSEPYLFLNSKGKQCNKISRDITNNFQIVTGIPKTITATNTRHNTVTTICSNLPRDDQEVVHRGMGHTAQTAHKYYRDLASADDHIKAYELIKAANERGRKSNTCEVETQDAADGGEDNEHTEPNMTNGGDCTDDEEDRIEVESSVEVATSGSRKGNNKFSIEVLDQLYKTLGGYIKKGQVPRPEARKLIAGNPILRREGVQRCYDKARMDSYKYRK